MTFAPIISKACSASGLPFCSENALLLQRLTHAFRIISHVATHLVLDITHGLFRKAQQTQQGLSQAQQTIQQAVEQPAQTISQAESELKAAWLRLQQHAVAGGDALMKMLHSLDKPSITLDAKWADMQEQLAGNKDVRYVLEQQQLAYLLVLLLLSLANLHDILSAGQTQNWLRNHCCCA